MAIICKNCNHTFTGHYCNNCGQPADTHKLDIHFLLHEIQHSFFHINRGFFYTAKELLLRPGHAIRDFIEGKRIKHFKPLSLIIILGSIYGLLYHYFNIKMYVTPDANEVIDSEKFNEWVGTHFGWITIATIPLYTLGTYIAFRKQGYNGIELLILNTFKAGQRLLVHIAIFPLFYIYSGTPTIRIISLIVYSIDLILIFWTNIQFFNKLSKTKAFLLSIVSHTIFLTSLILIIVIVLGIIGKV